LLDQHLHQIETLRRNGTPLDCIIVGNSLPLLGIDPDILGAEFARRSGGRLSCYDFALPGVRADGAAILAQVLQEDFSPWLIIYATSTRDFVIEAEEVQIGPIPWLQYRSGELAPEGWLIDHSYAYRYYLVLRGLSDPTRRSRTIYQYKTTARGYVNAHPGFGSSQSEMLAQLKSRLVDQLVEGVSAPQLEGLRRLLELHRPGRQVALLEMPAVPGLVRSLGDAAANYDLVLRTVADEAQRKRVPFWQVTQGALPDSGWLDRTRPC
jgi:hypothetical protein